MRVKELICKVIMLLCMFGCLVEVEENFNMNLKSEYLVGLHYEVKNISRFVSS